MENKNLPEYLDKVIMESLDVHTRVLKSPYPEIYVSLSSRYLLEIEFSPVGLPDVRVKIYDKLYNLLGYLDYGTYINLYGGNHYFGNREKGRSAEKGKEKDRLFQYLDSLAEEMAKKHKLELIETENYGKYGDPSAYDIWSLVPKGEFRDIYTGSKKGIINLCRAWNVESLQEPKIEFSKRAIERAKEIHKKATEFLEKKYSEPFLKDIGALVLWEEMRDLIHSVYFTPLSKERYVKKEKEE